jgi:hypothetical protein
VGKKPAKSTAKGLKTLKPKTQDVKGGNRASKAQSDMSSKWSSTLNGIAQNLKG